MWGLDFLFSFQLRSSWPPAPGSSFSSPFSFIPRIHYGRCSSFFAVQPLTTRTKACQLKDKDPCTSQGQSVYTRAAKYRPRAAVQEKAYMSVYIARACDSEPPVSQGSSRIAIHGFTNAIYRRTAAPLRSQCLLIPQLRCPLGLGLWKTLLVHVLCVQTSQGLSSSFAKECQ